MGKHSAIVRPERLRLGAASYTTRATSRRHSRGQATASSSPLRQLSASAQLRPRSVRPLVLMLAIRPPSLPQSSTRRARRPSPLTLADSHREV